MSKRFRTCDLDQPYLLPPSLQEWLPENHLARFIADVMNELDLTALYAAYERKDGRGLAAYHPLMMTRLLLYGYCTGVTSSRAIEKATYEQVPFRYLAADQHPDHDTIAAFRQEHLEALSGLFVQTLRLCQKAGMVKLGTVAIDGTKMLANASTRRSVLPQKLKESEQYWRETVEHLLAQAREKDCAEDERLGRGEAERDLPEELANAQQRLARIRQARAELEKDASQRVEAAERRAGTAQLRRRGRPRKEEAASLPGDPEARQSRRILLRQVARARQQAQSPQRQYNFVDPDSRVMRDGARKCFVQAYNAQLAVDADQQVIVAAEITQQATDTLQLLPMIESVRRTAGAPPQTAIADGGYWDTTSLRDPAIEGIQILVPPERDPADAGTRCRNREACAMRERLQSESGRESYALRKITVEPVIGQIKEVRGIRRFRVRGLVKVSQEWKLICTTHNLLKLFRHHPTATPKRGGTSPRSRPAPVRCRVLTRRPFFRSRLRCHDATATNRFARAGRFLSDRLSG